VDQGILIVEAPRSHSDTPHSVGLLWTSDQPDEATAIWKQTRLTRDSAPYPPAGFEPSNPSKRAATDHDIITPVSFYCNSPDIIHAFCYLMRFVLVSSLRVFIGGFLFDIF